MSLNVEFHLSNPGELTNVIARLRGNFAAMGYRVGEVVKALGEEGKDLAQLYILSRPARTSEGPGRTRTWAMHDAVTVKGEASQNYAGTRFGWENGDDYFGYQEQGFQHRNGPSVEGMYAVTDAIAAILAKTEGAVRAVAHP